MNPAGRRWAVTTLRRRWPSIVALVLLTAIAGGAAMTAAMGARRSADVVQDTLDERRHPHVMMLTSLPDVDWDKIVHKPYVESYGIMAATALCLTETGGIEDTSKALCAQPPAGGGWYDTIDRYDVLEGRAPTGPFEIAINRKAQKQYDWKPGTKLHIAGVRPGRLMDYWSGKKRGKEPWGPTYELTVTGVTEGADDPWRVLGGGTGHPGFIMTNAFVPETKDEIEYLPQAWLRLRNGEQDLPQLRSDARALGGDDLVLPITNVVEAQRRIERTTRVESTALWLFALALLAAAAILVGQGLARMIRGGRAEAATLRSLGMPPRSLVVALATPGLVVAAVGALAAVAVSIATSPVMPIGEARTFERHDGIKVDELVLIAGGLGIALAIALTALGTALAAVRELLDPAAGKPTRAAPSITRLPLPPTMALGVRMAFERRPGGDAIPVRSALIGAFVGVLTVTAALTVHRGISETVRHPERAGQTIDAGYFAGKLKDDSVIDDPDIARASEVTRTTADLDGLPVKTYTIRPVGTPLREVIIDGRAPKAADEVTLGTSTADVLGVEVGDTLPAGPRGGAPLQVVGTALLFEEGGHAAYDEGAWVTEQGVQRLNAPDAEADYIFVDAVPGADIDALDKRMAAAGGERDGQWPGLSVAAIDNLETVRNLPSYLAVFLALLGTGALAHTLVSTVRRRSHDLAVLRALGLTRRGARAVIAWQATTIGVVAVVLGMPLGILLGRIVWHVIATSTPIVYVAPSIGLATLLVAPVTLLLVNVLALWPGRAGSRLRPAVALRAP